MTRSWCFTQFTLLLQLGLGNRSCTLLFAITESGQEVARVETPKNLIPTKKWMTLTLSFGLSSSEFILLLNCDQVYRNTSLPAELTLPSVGEVWMGNSPKSHPQLLGKTS